MKKAILTYQIYDKVFSSVFHTKIDGTFISDCKLFELSFKKSTTKGSTVYGGKIIWIDSKRPPVGLKLLNLEVEVQNWDSYEGTKILQHGYQSWSFTSSYAEREKDVSPIFGFLQYSQENVYTKQSGREGDFQSEGFFLAHSESADSGFLIGVLDTQNENVKFHIKLNNEGRPISLGMIYDFYFSPESRSELKVKLPEIEYVPFKGTPEKEMEKYFGKLKKKYVKKQFPKKVPTGWCSWYYYYTAITEEIILENLREVKRKRLPLSFFQIDDGYQREIGDWTTTNEKFPKGMRYLAEEIKAENLTPGIWLAPFLVRKKSEFFQKFPEAVLKNESGNPVPALWNYLWGWDYTYCIDVTHPAAINFMETTFRTLVHEFKYPYLKLDFLYAACLPGVTYKRNLPPATRYVNTIKLIRKIVGKDVFLLGCGAPTMPSIGLFDGMRIGCDVAPFWYPEKIRRHLRDKNALCTEKALINAINRSQMHRNFWLND
ncbi:MAG: alpha-galactosidase, partial [Leptospira sp.]|nr:alpha-galactosidase [Leptospira sp.]